MKVSNDTLNMIVRRLANQMPVRYYLHWNYPNEPLQCVLELYCNERDRNEMLVKELHKLGFLKLSIERTIERHSGFRVERWIAERDLNEPA